MSKSTGNFLTLRQAIDKFSADGMRLALADAGDTLEDANFVEKMADAGILRLFTFHEWIKEMLEEKEPLRTGSCDLFDDRVFESEINRAIRLTQENYDNMMYREALKTGFYELQASRDKYREVCVDGMHKDLITRFIEKGSIIKASWPVAGKEDDVLLQASAYLENITHELRLRIKSLTAPKTKKQKTSAPPPKPDHGLIYVASSFPPWQHVTLMTLKSLYHSNGGSFPDNRDIMKELKSKPEVQKYMKKLMSFVQFVRGNVEKDGLSAMDTALAFDERKVLMENQRYLKKALGLDQIEIMSSREGDTKVQEDCAPGKPYAVFSSKQNMVNGVDHGISEKAPLSKPVCRFVNVQLVGAKPACGANGSRATILLENPKGEFLLDYCQLRDQVKSVFGLRDRKLILCGSMNCDKGMTDNGIDRLVTLAMM
ncbi:Leucine--tRNA ligase, cytoplasmic [Exaiptasia diaphana]|nr:Leucine--tRNA ligase, cytoplasmic [Exaiptasia diaphana]